MQILYNKLPMTKATKQVLLMQAVMRMTKAIATVIMTVRTVGIAVLIYTQMVYVLIANLV